MMDTIEGIFHKPATCGLFAVDVVIIGAGAAGLMCAAQAGSRGRRVVLLDKARQVGSKILISGGGRCNFTNLHVNPTAYLSQNPHFCKSALARYTPQDFLLLMRQHGLSWHEKTAGQLFCDQKAPAVVKMLVDECRQAGVRLALDTSVQAIEPQQPEGFVLRTSQQESIVCQSLVVATGGPSIPRMGASDFGREVARRLGIRSIPFSPALVPLTFGQPLPALLQGLAGVSVAVEASCQGVTFQGNMLFTHRGLSGPALLQISSYWQPGETLFINLLPGRNALTWLQHLQQQRPKAELKTVLGEVLPQRLALRLCDSLFTSRPLGQYGMRQLQSIATTLQAWELQPVGTEGMRTAEVSLGGIDTRELSSRTLEAKHRPGLYFIGETVDVTGWLGGYNLHWAWASGWCAGQVA